MKNPVKLLREARNFDATRGCLCIVYSVAYLRAGQGGPVPGKKIFGPNNFWVVFVFFFTWKKMHIPTLSREVWRRNDCLDFFGAIFKSFEIHTSSSNQYSLRWNQSWRDSSILRVGLFCGSLLQFMSRRLKIRLLQILRQKESDSFNLRLPDSFATHLRLICDSLAN